jgi:DnaJ family protein A protein 5
MGQSSSSSGATGTSTPASQLAATCYYELLSVERTATPEEIKKAYRKKALELHPDRNYNDVERATKLFAEVQTAYEVLSDPQERAWYDSHRDAILRGHQPGDSDAVDATTSEDVLGWFSQFSVSMSFDDTDPRGFFVLARKAFTKLAEEEEAAAKWEGVEPIYYPGFGDAKDTYDTYESRAVKDFYLAWTNFTTKKSFSWCDVYKYSDAPDRRVKRLMEKENMKARENARKVFNDTVIGFVKFVRKRDPRFTPNTQTEVERQAELLRKSKEQAAKQRAENQKKRGEYQAPGWTRVGDEEKAEDWASGDEEVEESEEEEEEEEEEIERYECIVCKKTFRSQGQMDAHEKSKKHVKAVQQLKRKMMKENKKFDLDRDVRGRENLHEEEFTPMESSDELEVEDMDGAEVGGGGEDNEESPAKPARVDSDREAADEHQDTPPNPTQQPTPNPESSVASEEDSNDEYASSEKFQARILGEEDGISSGLASTTLSDAEDSKAAPKLGKAKAKRAKRAQKAAAADEESKSSDVSALNPASLAVY